MQLTLGQIYDSISAINLLAEEKLPRQAAYNLSKVRKAALAEAQELEGVRIALIEKYGPGQVQPERLADFLQEWAEARAVTTELWATPIPFTQLPETISAVNLDALAWLIEFSVERAEDRTEERAAAAG